MNLLYNIINKIKLFINKLTDSFFIVKNLTYFSIIPSTRIKGSVSINLLFLS